MLQPWCSYGIASLGKKRPVTVPRGQYTAPDAGWRAARPDNYRSSDTFVAQGGQYDGAGRLVYTQLSGPATYTDYARYNGDGLRLYTDMGKGDTGSIWDVNRSLPVVLFEDTPDGPVFSLYGLGQIARVRVNAQGQEQTAYYHQDGGGSVRAVTDVQGKTLVAYDYAAFGGVRREFIRPVNGNPQNNPAKANAWRYAGEHADAQTGLNYHRARYYDPSIGRFTQTDPLGDGYAYAANNPATHGDPTGLFLDTIQLIFAH